MQGSKTKERFINKYMVTIFSPQKLICLQKHRNLSEEAITHTLFGQQVTLHQYLMAQYLTTFGAV